MRIKVIAYGCNTVSGLKLVLIIMFAVVSFYTFRVANSDGINLFSIFFSDIQAVSWPGQFNLDFLCILLLTGLWVAWRHEFSSLGIALGLAATVGGIVFLSVYLLVTIARSKDDVYRLLLGDIRAKQMSHTIVANSVK